MSILNTLLVGLLFILGVGTSIVLIGYMLVVIFQKLYGKIVHGKSFYD